MANEGMTPEQDSEFIHKEVDKRMISVVKTWVAIIGIANAVVLWGIYENVQSMARSKGEDIVKSVEDEVAKEVDHALKTAQIVTGITEEYRKAHIQLVGVSSQVDKTQKEAVAIQDENLVLSRKIKDTKRLVDQQYSTVSERRDEIDELSQRIASLQKLATGLDGKQGREKLEELRNLARILESGEPLAQLRDLMTKYEKLDRQVINLEVPIGTILPWHRHIKKNGEVIELDIPDGWAPCNGQQVEGYQIPNLNSEKYAGGRGIYLRGGEKSGELNESTYWTDNSYQYLLNAHSNKGHWGAGYAALADLDNKENKLETYSTPMEGSLKDSRRFQVAAMTVVWIIKIK